MTSNATSNLRHVQPQILSAEAFAQFGDVFETPPTSEPRLINYGHTLRFSELVNIDVHRNDGEPSLSIYRSEPLQPPVIVELMERHPYGSQMFYPLGSHPYLVVVAPPGDFDPATVAAFKAAPRQGINYRAGVWHHYSLAMAGTSDFLVLDRSGPGESTEEVRLAPEDRVVIEL